MNNISIDFNNKYNQNNWLNFLKSDFLPDDFEPQDEEIDIDFSTTYIKKVTLIGLCNSLSLNIYEIIHKSENDPRVSISRESFRLMASYGVKRALILFVSSTSNNYRFSLIILDLHLESKTVVKIFSNPRRYSYFLGPEAKKHTPEQYLIKKGRVTDEENLLERFSIEVVNKEFYEKIALFFTKLTGGIRKVGNRNQEFSPLLSLPGTQDHETLQRFGVRLIGRIIFCWFLKEKKSQNNIPIIPDEILSLNAIKKNYYHSILEPLFFEVLNTPIGKRKSFIKQESKWENIPFLNGGLFDPNLHQDFYQIDDVLGKSLHLNTLYIPDDWFKEFFEILETYNFTIDENTSVDIDLSIDPEMLGRIFENLLAEINPDTQKTARKATGSYYTPRPIVEYMVDESLIQYLLTKLKSFGIVENLPNGLKDVENSTPCESASWRTFARSELEQKIRNLLDYTIEEKELSEKEKNAVIDALDEVKIIDPACGSGAFPMGMLQKMLLILQKVDPQSLVWLIKQLDKIPNPMVKKAVEDELMNKNWDYIHKMGLIQHSIYGVDIQPIAVELSKLRFFLTLVVDEDINDKAENRGINPLPNLSFKFVAANTLIGLPKKEQQQNAFDKEFIEPKIAKLQKVREDFFHSQGNEKENLKTEFMKIQTDIGITLFQHKDSFSNKIAVELTNWNPFKDDSTGWFDPKWMFGIKDGFDVVIGNPPYLSAVTMARNTQIKKYFKKHYTLATGSYDIYILFLLKGVELINDLGTYSWIIPNKFLIADYAKNTKNFLITKKGLFNSIDVSTFNVFKESGIYPIIIIGQNYSKDEFNKLFIKEYKDLELRKFVNPKKLKTYKTFKEMGIKIHAGTTGFQASKIKPFITNYPLPNSFPFIVSGNIDRYCWSHDNVRYMKSYYNIAYINKNKFVSETKWKFWKKPKIIVAGMTKVLESVYISESIGLGVGIYGLYDFAGYNPYCLTGILNSKYLTFYFREKFKDKHLAGGYLAINKSTIENLPLVQIDYLMQDKISKLVKKILKMKEENHKINTSELENKIDLMVYKLYELTYEEVKIVDSDFCLSKKEYVNFNIEQIESKSDKKCYT
ncbi:MAG: Eco57I restriction-modification methylase domain-containing protein [Candidatus Cloacimonetes bacterium]|nr:Eco57I restriction-modification methylase domain-containing protein [Candidatus Cloacimonadota bacterium]